MQQGTVESRKAFMAKICVPFIFATCMGCVVYAALHRKFPKDASPEEWQHFVNAVVSELRYTEHYKIVLLVFLVHVGHTVLCIPCVHLTQMLLGYCLGFVYASLVCATCECIIISLFVLWSSVAVRNSTDTQFDQFVAHLRARNLLYPFIFMSQMSSVPINSTSCIIGLGSVTAKEYLYIHYVVSTINSLKCCFIGHQIRITTHKATVLCLGYIIFGISVLPTIITLALWYYVVVVCRDLCASQPEETTDEGPPTTLHSTIYSHFSEIRNMLPLKYPFFSTYKYNAIEAVSADEAPHATGPGSSSSAVHHTGSSQLAANEAAVSPRAVLPLLVPAGSLLQHCVAEAHPAELVEAPVQPAGSLLHHCVAEAHPAELVEPPAPPVPPEDTHSQQPIRADGSQQHLSAELSP